MKRTTVFLVFSLIVILLVLFSGIALSGVKAKSRIGFLGVFLCELNQDLRESLNYKGEGAFVDNVQDDTPAEEAGIEPGDVIIEFDKKTIKSADHLRDIIRETKPNLKVKIVVLRDGEEKSLKAVIGARRDYESYSGIVKKCLPEILLNLGPQRIHYCFSERGFLGIDMDDLSKGLAEYFAVESGALITDVVVGSPAEKSGLKAGDVIIEFDSRKVEDASDVLHFIEKTGPGDEITIKVNRRGQILTFNVVLAELPSDYQHNIQIIKDLDCEFEDLNIELKGLDKDLKKLEKIKKIQVLFDDEGKAHEFETNVAD